MKMIFNSVGSNYNFSTAWLSFRQLFGATVTREYLQTQIAQVFSVPSDNVILFYKGRDAIEYVLKSYGIGQGDAVITQAFSCFALEEAIIRTGAIPAYVDLAPNALAPTVEQLDELYMRYRGQVKAVIIQHSLGYPADIFAIKRWCDARGILLIEDLAQAIGAVDPHGDLLGTYADAIVLSFGRDKIVDGVTGGGAIIKKAPNNQVEIDTVGPSSNQITKELLYPMINWKIRTFYSIGIGKLIHAVVKKLGLLTSPILSVTTTLSILPEKYCALISRQVSEINSSLHHRKAVAKIYAKLLSTDIQLVSDEAIETGSNLRFPIVIGDIDSLLAFLHMRGIYLSDRWYRAGVDCGNTGCSSVYKEGSCLNAEGLAQHIINLPTHRQISATIAEQIAQYVMFWKESTGEPDIKRELLDDNSIQKYTAVSMQTAAEIVEQQRE